MKSDYNKKEANKISKELSKEITPILNQEENSIKHVSMWKRFLIFEALNNLKEKIDTNPYLNFLSLLKHESLTSPIKSGSIKKLYHERTKNSFKRFFRDKELYKLIREDIEYVYSINKDVNMTITRDGVVIYDNYKKNAFNIFLLTIHSGTFVPEKIQRKMALSPIQRRKEEDVGSERLYCKIVLKQNGIWLDNKYSRFYCDTNRSRKNCIYENGKLDQVKQVWKEPLSEKEKRDIFKFYDDFYLIINDILSSYNFNMIFDGHTMKNLKGRPDISFGTNVIPKFYLPIVSSMLRKIKSLGYEKTGINAPYPVGYMMYWMAHQYPALFTFSMEVNKKIYMTKDRMKSAVRKIEKLSDDLVQIFDIIEDEEPKYKTYDSFKYLY